MRHLKRIHPCLTERLKTLLLLLACVVPLVTGCASMAQVIAEKEEHGGTTRTYPVSFDDAWRISISVFREEGADAIEEHKPEGYMLTSSGPAAFTHGTFMGAWFTALSPRETQVTVVTKRRYTLHVATTLTEGTYHRRFAEAVQILKSVKAERR
jgi:hypothetical protein